jgi:hypothetical protein
MAKGKTNSALKSWVTFVKKVQKEENITYPEAMKRAKVRKSEWKRGGASMEDTSSPMSSSSGSFTSSPMDLAEASSSSSPMGMSMSGGKRRTKKRGSKKRASKKRKGTKKRRSSRKR